QPPPGRTMQMVPAVQKPHCPIRGQRIPRETRDPSGESPLSVHRVAARSYSGLLPFYAHIIHSRVGTIQHRERKTSQRRVPVLQVLSRLSRGCDGTGKKSPSGALASRCLLTFVP